MSLEKKWIWQRETYPNFEYNQTRLEPLLQGIRYYQGLLDGIYMGMNDEDLGKAQIEIFTQEIIDTSAIEGEVLSRDSVRSSLSNKFRIEIGLKDSSNKKTESGISTRKYASLAKVSKVTASRELKDLVD